MYVPVVNTASKECYDATVLRTNLPFGFLVHRPRPHSTLREESRIFLRPSPQATNKNNKTNDDDAKNNKTEQQKKQLKAADLKPEPSKINAASAAAEGSGDVEEQFEKIMIKDLRSDTLEELLTYIYTDCSVNVDLMANSLLAAADQYQLPGLKTNCEKHFGEIISPNNVASVLMMAENYKCQNLKKSALSYCKVLND